MKRGKKKCCFKKNHLPDHHRDCICGKSFGAFGPFGVFGPFGAFGLCNQCGTTAATGPIGPTGPPGLSTIIPFASGLPITLDTNPDGSTAVVSYVGFGNSLSSFFVPSPTVDLTSVPEVYAFSLPRGGTITSIDAYFSTSADTTFLDTTATITAQLFESTAPNNVFSPISGTLVTLTPSFSNFIPQGSICEGLLTGLSIPVAVRTRLILIFSMTTSGLNLSQQFFGYADAGIAIS